MKKDNLPLSYSKSILEFICTESMDNSVNQDKKLKGAEESTQLRFSASVICFLERVQSQLHGGQRRSEKTVAGTSLQLK